MGIGTVHHRVVDMFSIVQAILAAALLWLLMRLSRGTSTLPLRRATDGILVAVALSALASAYLRVASVSDYRAYLRLAHRLAEGGANTILNMSAYRPPGMPFALALPLSLGLPDSVTVWSVNALSMLLVYFLVRRFLGHRTGGKSSVILAATVIAVSVFPFLLIALSEIPAFALTLGSLLLLPTNRDEMAKVPHRNLLLAGGLAGLSSLFRPILVLQVPVMMAAIVLAAYKSGNGRRGVSPLFVPALVILLGFTLVIAPWSIRNGYKYRAFVPISTNGGVVFYSANSSPDWRLQGRFVPAHYEQLRQWYPDEVTRNKEGFVLGVRNLITYPGAALISIPWRVGQMLSRAGVWPAVYTAENQARHSYEVVFSIVLVCILLGLWGLWYRGWQLWRTVRNQLYDGDAIPWHQVAFAVIFIASLFFECSGRYVLSVLPFVIVVWLKAETGPPTGACLERLNP